MIQTSMNSYYIKIFLLIIRIREDERKTSLNLLTRIKYGYFNFRDRARVIFGLHIANVIFTRGKEHIPFLWSCYQNRHMSHGQIFQDVLAHFISPKTHGYFVEFGAADGCFLSNTHFLEKQYSWNGILAEPAKTWVKQLKNNRATCTLDFRCVWNRTGEKIEFVEDALPEISGVSTTLNKERMSENSASYMVATVSLIDLLEEHHAPKYIDYISIDTEGSEFEILEHFDFSRYQFGLITIEHNYETEKREKLFALLSRNHYMQIFQNISSEDDWYIPCTNNEFGKC